METVYIHTTRTSKLYYLIGKLLRASMYFICKVSYLHYFPRIQLEWYIPEFKSVLDEFIPQNTLFLSYFLPHKLRNNYYHFNDKFQICMLCTDIQRRSLEYEERNYLVETGYITETQSNLGLLAVKSDDVLIIMQEEYPVKYKVCS